MLFVLLATVAVGGLASGDAGAEAWLRRVLLECVLAPAYLFSGVSKMRYRRRRRGARRGSRRGRHAAVLGSIV